MRALVIGAAMLCSVTNGARAEIWGVAGIGIKSCAQLDEEKAWLRNYCDSHPLEKYSRAVGALLGVLDVIPPKGQ